MISKSKPAGKSQDDYPLRYAPLHYRRWRPWTIALTALGGIAYLADFSIGAMIALSYGTINALIGIILAAFVIFASSFPLAWYSARYNIDLDLISRGAGFGYAGSVLTALVFASFTCILFALEGSIMAQGLALGVGLPLWAGYLFSTLIVFPFVLYGMKVLARMQVWTTPLWLILMLGPVFWLIGRQPDLVPHFFSFTGTDKRAGVALAPVLLSAGVALALMAQIGEQIDYLRFMPPCTKENRLVWWSSVIAAGPGWVLLGALKQAIGAFLGVFVLTQAGQSLATQPVQQFLLAFEAMLPRHWALLIAVLLVVISQIKINVTNAYSGSLAWTSVYTRLIGHFPGRLVFLVVNLALALLLMEGNMFAFLGKILSLYADCATSWIMTVSADIVLNKYLFGLSPREPEYRCEMLPDLNPVGILGFCSTTILSILCYEGVFGGELQSYSILVAVTLPVFFTPFLAWATKGRFYRLRHDDGIAEPRFGADGQASSTLYHCAACQDEFERPDIIFSLRAENQLCSLCVGMLKTHK